MTEKMYCTALYIFSDMRRGGFGKKVKGNKLKINKECLFTLHKTLLCKLLSRGPEDKSS